MKDTGLRIVKTRTDAGVRLNKYLASCGLGSRRSVERLIREGRVSLNGVKVTDLAIKVKPGDVVRVDGRQVRPLSTCSYYAFHKPRGLLCSRKDDKGRPLIYDILDVEKNVQSIGRLDMDSEGLLLLTNDGELAHRLMHPSSGILREYRVRILGHPDPETLARLQKGGIPIGRGEKSVAWEITVDAETRCHSWLTVRLRSGRWREVRRTLAACGHPVRRLIRTRFGPIELGDLPRGELRPLSKKEIEALQRIGR